MLDDDLSAVKCLASFEPADRLGEASSHFPYVGCTRPGLRTVKAGILSRPGESVLKRHGIAYEQLVDRIRCQTEELLAKIEEPEDAYGWLKVPAGRYCVFRS